jgi:DNA-binding HxlR family transcriptional regulator
MRGYGQFCPVAKAAEIFAERWTPLIVRELLFGSHHFNELRLGIPRISQSLLAQRLRSLEHDGVVERRRAPDGRSWEYHLTATGEALRPVVEQLGMWGYRWTGHRLHDEELEPREVMWFLRRQIDVEQLPDRRVVVQFDFAAGRLRRCWLVLHPPDVDLCLRDEGFDVDLFVSAEPRALAEAILGHGDLRQAIRQGRVRIDGPRPLADALPDWIRITSFAHRDQATAALAS